MQSETLTADDYVQGILKGNRTVLSRAITFIESTKREHQELAREIVDQCLPETGNSVRIAVTGSPGVGKSTFIEAMGNDIIKEGSKLAVLAIDPSSTESRGSILGDKTRMQTLANNPDAFIRPSPSAGTLGGVARKTRETIFLCEAAGYDTIFIETVGVGQADTAVHSMVDFFLLLMLPGAGDELQGIKRGIVEMADAIAVNKTDSQSEKQVQKAVQEYKSALRLFPSSKSGWQPKLRTCSALEKTGISEIWQMIQSYITITQENGFFEQNRNEQALHWMFELIHHELREDFYRDSAVSRALHKTKVEVKEGQLSSFKAARKLLGIYSNTQE